MKYSITVNSYDRHLGYSEILKSQLPKGQYDIQITAYSTTMEEFKELLGKKVFTTVKEYKKKSGLYAVYGILRLNSIQINMFVHDYDTPITDTQEKWESWDDE